MKAQTKATRALSSADNFVNSMLGKRVEVKNGRIYIYDTQNTNPTIVCLGRRPLR